MKGAAFSNDTHLKFIPVKVNGLRKKTQAVIVFLKLDRYLSQIIYRNFVRNLLYSGGLKTKRMHSNIVFLKLNQYLT